MDDELEGITRRTLGHYQSSADRFREGTRDHDVSQNYSAFLGAMEPEPPLSILDLGCGPGRDLAHFARLGHHAVGLDGCEAFCAMARALAGSPVLQQNFLALRLEPASYDGVFANASLFHVPMRELPRVLSELRSALRPRGVLFSSNPRGDDREGWNGERYGTYIEYERWRDLVTAVGFEEVAHYYRPPGRPRNEQPWLASVWRRLA